MFGHTLPKYSLPMFALFSLVDCLWDVFIIGWLIVMSRVLPPGMPPQLILPVPIFYPALICAAYLAGLFMPVLDLVDEDTSPVTSRENCPLNLVSYGLANVTKALLAASLVGTGYLLSCIPGCPIAGLLAIAVSFGVVMRLYFISKHFEDTSEKRYLTRLKDLASA